MTQYFIQNKTVLEGIREGLSYKIDGKIYKLTELAQEGIQPITKEGLKYFLETA